MTVPETDYFFPHILLNTDLSEAISSEIVGPNEFYILCNKHS
jgi:hypothetical protein